MVILGFEESTAGVQAIDFGVNLGVEGAAQAVLCALRPACHDDQDQAMTVWHQCGNAAQCMPQLRNIKDQLLRFCFDVVVIRLVCRRPRCGILTGKHE